MKLDYSVRYVDLPASTKGVSVLDNQGYCNVYINSHLSHAEQNKALTHELAHVTRDDFEKADQHIGLVEMYCK